MKVYLVGAGPGDPGLLTTKGLQVLEIADVIIYDALINPHILKYAKRDAEIIYVGKIAGNHALPQQQINELLAQKARENKVVARLKGGDPYIFGRGGEEGEYLAAQNIPFEEIPGISSAIAAPAYAGIPLTHRDFTSSVMIITGHEKPEKTTSSLNWKAMVQSGATLVFVMGMKNLVAISTNLLNAGMKADTPAAVIYRGTTPMQKSVFSTVQKLPEDAASFSNPSVIVIGRVASLHSSLDWFEKKPLLGRRIVVTRAREQASDISKALMNLGADVIECPSIKIDPMSDYALADAAIGTLQHYSWIIFTSVNGVKYFWQRLVKANKDSRALGGAKVAAIGPATAAALEKHGIIPDLVPESYVAESVAAELLRIEGPALKGMRILLPRAAEARMVLPDQLALAGAIVDIVPLYEAHPASDKESEVLELLGEGGIDCISFGSSSTVRNFLKIVPREAIRKTRPALASIGPVTSATLRENGLQVDIEPEEYTIPALIQSIENHFKYKAEKKCL